MSDPINHHYIPQFYLKGFSENRATLLTLYNLKKRRFMTRSARTTMSIEHLYSTIEENGELNVGIEKFLGTLESATKPAFEKLEAGAVFTEEEYIALLFFIGYLYARIPGRLQHISDFHIRIASAIASEIPSGVENIEFKVGVASDTFTVTRKELELAQKEDWNAVLNTMQSLATSFAKTLLEFGTVAYRIKNETDSFVTTDNAVFVSPPPNLSPGEPFGFSAQGVRIVVPISQKVCLVFLRPIAPQQAGLMYADVTADTVKTLNRVVAAAGLEYVLGKNQNVIKNSLNLG